MGGDQLLALEPCASEWTSVVVAEPGLDLKPLVCVAILGDNGVTHELAPKWDRKTLARA